MHKLNRPPAPTCLNNYDYAHNNWCKVTSDDKDEIWAHLNQMQQQRCAYCERNIKKKSRRHIEHFRRRCRYPKYMFKWSNLFGSCNTKTSCGKHKDKPGSKYNPDQLIKPDCEDPEDFLLFLSNGKVVPKSGLLGQDLKKAKNTICIFNLNGALRQTRETYVKSYLEDAEVIAELATEYDDWRQLSEQRFAELQHLPFATAIKHLLLSN